MSYYQNIIGLGGTDAPQDNTKYMVTFWYQKDKTSQTSGDLLKAYFSDLGDAENFQNKYRNHPEYAELHPYLPPTIKS